jgi:hypothetical protein
MFLFESSRLGLHTMSTVCLLYGACRGPRNLGFGLTTAVPKVLFPRKSRATCLLVIRFGSPSRSLSERSQTLEAADRIYETGARYLLYEVVSYLLLSRSTIKRRYISPAKLKTVKPNEKSSRQLPNLPYDRCVFTKYERRRSLWRA